MDHLTPQPLIPTALPTKPEQGLVNHSSEASGGPVGAQGRLPQNVSQQHTILNLNHLRFATWLPTRRMGKGGSGSLRLSDATNYI